MAVFNFALARIGIFLEQLNFNNKKQPVCNY